MYKLYEFCNIISLLRREKGWTQAEFADRLGISPQSISKWECGVGLPDVTLFPLIAETLSVPIGILFGEKNKTEEGTNMENNQYEAGYTEEFEVCDTISVRCGNVCRIEVIHGVREKGYVRVVGDPVFLRYFALEEHISGQKEPDGLLVNIKNPTGSAIIWKPYDREGYTGENFVQIFTGGSKFDVNVTVYNYLDLHAANTINSQGNFEVRISSECRQS